MAHYDNALDWLATRLVSHMTCPADPTKTPTHSDIDQLQRTLRPGDVLLIDGCDRISAAIRYFTQSSWSHAAMFVGDVPGTEGPGCRPHSLVEMNLGEGCISAPLDKYRLYPTRICRPTRLSEEDRATIVKYLIDNIGLKYDTRNVIDLARFLLPGLPIPRRFRRRLLSLGSGEPTRAICSTLIAQAFQTVRYPILPRVERAGPSSGLDGYTADEIFHIRHHSHFAPRDFDLSPYFEIVKPLLADGFDYRQVTWADVAGAHRPLLDRAIEN